VCAVAGLPPVPRAQEILQRFLRLCQATIESADS
jgi:hypothetical protein